MTSKKIGRNYWNVFLYSSESISNILFSLISVALIARHFGPEQMSRYNVAQSISVVFTVVATLGLDQFIVKEMARNSRNAVYATTMQASMLIGWILYASLFVSYFIIIGNFERDLALLLCVALSTLFTRVLFIKVYLQAQNDPKPIALGAMLSRLAAIAYLFMGSSIDLSFEMMMLYLPLQAISMFLVMLISRPEWVGLLRPRNFQFGYLVAGLREAFPLFIASALYFFYSQSDIIIMSHLRDDTEVGVYSAAIRLVPLAGFIGFSLLATFYRQMEVRLAKSREELDSFVRQILAVHFVAGLFMAATVTLCADLLVELLYGERFAQSAMILKIGCWAWVFMMPAAIYSRLLVMLGMTKYELIKMILVAPMVVGLNYLAIAHIGIVAAAAMTVLAYLAVDFLVYALFKDTRQFFMLGVGALADILLHPIKTFRTSFTLLKAKY